MQKFTFRCDWDPDTLGNPESVELSCHEMMLDDVLEAVKRFLLGCGYSIDGEIEVVREGEE